MIYISNKRSMRNITAANLIKSIENLFVCEGTIYQTNEKGKVVYHVVQTDVSNNDEKKEVPFRPFSSKIYYQIPECVTLIEHTKKYAMFV